MAEGIEVRHRSGCPAGVKPPGKCACQPSYRAVVRARGGRKRAKTFHRIADARAWRATALAEVVRIPRLAAKTPTIAAASESVAAAMTSGAIRTRSGDPYKPATIRQYKNKMRLYVLPLIGHKRLDEVTLRDIQDLADAQLEIGHQASNAKTVLMPLRVIYRRALRDGLVSSNPCDHVELPAVRSKKPRIASPEEAARRLAVLEPRDRALWGCAFYAGLRNGEIRALRRERVDLAAGLIHVEDGWDDKEGRIEPKSRSGVRQVIIVAALRDYLAAHFAEGRFEPGDFVFPGRDGQQFGVTQVRRRAAEAWRAEGLEWIKMHDARHTCASIFIAAGVNAKALSEMMGHSSIAITFDVYGHLMPGSRDEARELVDAYLERALR